MATMNADAWQQSGVRPDRYASRPQRPDYRSLPMDRSGRPVRGAGQPQRRTPDRSRAPERPRPADRGRAADRGRPIERDYYSEPVDRPRGSFRRPERDFDPERDPRRDYDRDLDPRDRRSSARDRDRDYAPARGRAQAPERGGRVRGVVAVIGIFLITLAGAAVDSFIGIGLGTVTLGALVGSTAIASLVVRRRDLASVVVAPPLIFIAVAGLNIALAPSASLNTATVATLLIRGFPTMAIATGVALVLALIRLVARR
jgi:hypothetical protein